MKLLVTTFAVAVASAMFPLINIEAYIAGVVAVVETPGLWPVSVAAAAGQTAGKILWYLVGRSSMNWHFIRKKMASPRWQRQYERVKVRTDRQPWTGVVLLFASATIGFPPLAIMAVLAGQLRFNLLWFVLTTFVGRTLRFAAVLGGVSLISDSGLFG
ncbi:MAG: VTT domain-containing protein [Nocardioidaceae bacterium]